MTDARDQVILTQKFERDRLAALLAIMEDAQQQVESIIAKVPTTNFKLSRARELQRQINAVLDEVQRALPAESRNIAEGIYTEAVGNSARRLVQLGVAGEISLGSQLNVAAIAAAADSIALDMNRAVESMRQTSNQFIRAAQLDAALNREITRKIGTGLAQGEALRSTTRTVAQTLLNNGVAEGKFVFIGGRRWKLTDYSELIARTRSREIASQGTINTVVSFGEDLVQVSVHEHPDVDPCTPFIGRVYSITGNATDFPKLDVRPPFHPNCYSDDTEVLTESGWQLISSWSGNKVFSLNPDTKVPEYVMPVGKVEKYAEKLLHFSSNNLDLLVTPDHQMFYETGWKHKNKKDDFQLVPALSLYGKKSGTFYCGANWVGDYCCSRVEAVFWGLYLSEGSMTKQGGYYVVSIAQSRKANPDKWQKIANIIEHVTRSIRKGKVCVSDDSFRFYVKGNIIGELKRIGKSAYKYIPCIIMNADPDTIRVFLDWFCLGDGSVKMGKQWNGGQFRDSRAFISSSPKMAADLGELILKAGKRPSYRRIECGGKEVEFRNGKYTINNDVWIVNECHSVYQNLQNCKYSMVDYGRDAVCLELPKYHVMLVRRNGKVTWSGNCRHVLIPIIREAMEADGEYDSLVALSKQPPPKSLTTKSLKKYNGTVISTHKQYRNLVS